MNESPRRRTSTLLLTAGAFLLAVAVSFTGGYLVHRWVNGPVVDYPLFDQAYRILESHGLKDMPDSEQMQSGMIRGLLAEYDDPYTVLVEPARHELQTGQLEGRFGGIGSRLERDSSGSLYLFPYPDSPAEKAGLYAGDQLLEVDSLVIDLETPMETIQAAIRGPVGEAVRLLVYRTSSGEELETIIVREEVLQPSVTWHLLPEEPTVGRVIVSIIAATSADEVTRAIRDLKDQGATHFILDLRDNAGGLVTGGVDLARLFLSEGDIMVQQYRGRPEETFSVRSPGEFADIPLVVIINHGTASASEIVAGSLQAHQRALLVGAPSLGKNTIQLIFDLDNGASLHVTAAEWWIPGIEFPQGEVGLRPDLTVSPDQAADADYLSLAVEALLGQRAAQP